MRPMLCARHARRGAPLQRAHAHLRFMCVHVACGRYARRHICWYENEKTVVVGPHLIHVL